MSTPRVAIATCAELPDLDADEPLLLEALHRLGVRAEPAVWDDTAVDWHAYDLVVIRSTWDYAPRREEFLAWAERVPRVLNPPDVLRWNTDKRYLGELRDAGVPVVPTSFLEPGEAFAPPAGEFVVKPAVSAGSRDTARYGSGEAADARAHVAALHAAGRVAMVQPYQASVDLRGETAVLFLGGSYSHAIRKGPLLARGQGLEARLFREEEISPRDPSPAERRAAERALDAVPGHRRRLFYARVDLVAGDGGEPLVLELELAEPSMFFAHGEGAADRLAGLALAELDRG